jgi:hypothetical protein
MPRADEILVVIDVGMTWRGGAQTAFETRTGRYTSGRLIGVLGQLHCFPGGGKVTLAWDNLPTGWRQARMRRVGVADGIGPVRRRRHGSGALAWIGLPFLTDQVRRETRP